MFSVGSRWSEAKIKLTKNPIVQTLYTQVQRDSVPELCQNYINHFHMQDSLILVESAITKFNNTKKEKQKTFNSRLKRLDVMFMSKTRWIQNYVD